VALSVGGAGSALCFSIADHGIGIAKADQERIFEPFRQVEEGTNRRFGGAGLGLSIVESLVELHDGHIWVESSPGQGSTFHVELPGEPAEPAR